MKDFIFPQSAKEFLSELPDASVNLFCIDPPYYKIVKEKWDSQWKTPEEYSAWLGELLALASTKLKSNGSLIMFAGLGKHGEHPIFDVVKEVEKSLVFRNWITWKKKRAYGKSHDYLYTREEILWFSKSPERTEVVFNIPYLDEKRGYAGFSEKYPAKSEYKRVSNVWDDITELFKTEREAQKPLPLLERIINTHSNKFDTVVDFFSGWGTTGVAALALQREFKGCEMNPEDAAKANQRCQEVFAKYGILK